MAFAAWIFAILTSLAFVAQAFALEVSSRSVTVPVGGSTVVTVSQIDGSVTVSSSNTGVAKVSYASGRATITGVSPGTATVTIRDGETSQMISVTVNGALTVTPASVSVTAGDNARVTVSNADGTVRVSSANTAVATVSYASGIATIHGVAAGSTTVTIRDSVTTRTVAVTVTSTAALTVTPTSSSVIVGNTVPILVTNATGTVNVSSSNNAIATVTYNGAGSATISGVAQGTATITIADRLNSRTVTVTVVSATAANYVLLAWNSLGMHCIDGVDYSIFSILPPLNFLDAQLKDKAGALISSGVTLTYQATPDLNGSINTTSSNKTNFWQYAQSLLGLNPAPDVGLLGYPMASNTPAPMGYSTTNNWFEANGIPITNYDDNHAKNDYPMVQVVAKNTAGQVLASTKVVLPVSDMLNCAACHTSNTGTNPATSNAKPAAGWVFDPDPLKDWKFNILRLHDEKEASNATFTSALQSKGYSGGLYNSAQAGKPVLCVACHSSNTWQVDAGVATGVPGVLPLTQAVHSMHASQLDPANGMTLDHVDNRASCYNCHPGSVTQCLRGAMSGPSYQCQSCHGNMSNVGKPTRQGWLSLPTCQSCHYSGQRLLNALDANGNPLTWSDQTFATTANVPSVGSSLYRFSTGHGGMKCSACHGSTHAEFPSTQPNDNVQSIATQGHAGTVNECSACHNPVPTTTNGGPHGMHTIGTVWVGAHQDAAESNRTACTYCHGSDYRGTFLSQVKTAKTVGSHTYAAGQLVSCYDCHNGPSGGALKGNNKLASQDKASLYDQVMSRLKGYFSRVSIPPLVDASAAHK